MLHLEMLLQYGPALRIELVHVARSVAVHLNAVGRRRDHGVLLDGMLPGRHREGRVLLLVAHLHIDIKDVGGLPAIPALLGLLLLGLLLLLLLLPRCRMLGAILSVAAGQQMQVDLIRDLIAIGIVAHEVEGVEVEGVEVGKVLVADSGNGGIKGLWLRPGRIHIV